MKKVSSALVFALIMLFIFTTGVIHAQNLGIGVPAPTQKLDVAGAVQFSGALMPNSLAGTTGQSLISQGGGVAPIWQSATQGQSFTTYYSTSSVTINYGLTYTLVPGLSQTITVPATGTYDLVISTDGGATFNSANSNQGVQLEISIWIDGTATNYWTEVVGNTSNLVNGINNWQKLITITNISAGSHTVSVYVRHISSTVAQSVTVAATNTVGNYLIASLTLGMIRK